MDRYRDFDWRKFRRVLKKIYEANSAKPTSPGGPRTPTKADVSRAAGKEKNPTWFSSLLEGTPKSPKTVRGSELQAICHFLHVPEDQRRELAAVVGCGYEVLKSIEMAPHKEGEFTVRRVLVLARADDPASAFNKLSALSKEWKSTTAVVRRTFGAHDLIVRIEVESPPVLTLTDKIRYSGVVDTTDTLLMRDDIGGRYDWPIAEEERPLEAFIFLRSAANRQEQLVNAIMQTAQDETTGVALYLATGLTGRFDAVAQVRCKNRNELDRFLSAVRSRQSQRGERVARTTTYVSTT